MDTGERVNWALNKAYYKKRAINNLSKKQLPTTQLYICCIISTVRINNNSEE